MKSKTLLSVLFSLFALAAIAQQPPFTFQMNKNQAIQFKDSGGLLDSTEIVRQGGNSLKFRYKNNNLIFHALDNKLFQIRNAADAVNIQFNPNGGKSFILGKLAVGADDAAIPAGFSFFVNGDVKATEVNAAFALDNAQKIRFKNAAGGFDATEIIRGSNNTLQFRYATNTLYFKAQDNKPLQIRNQDDIVKAQFHTDGSLPLELRNSSPGLELNDNDQTTGTPQIWVKNNLYLIHHGNSDAFNQTYRFYPIWGDTRGSDAVVDIFGKETGGFTKKLTLTHNGTNGVVSTGTGSLILSPNSGNVGIGTTSPEHKLHILNGGIGIQPDNSNEQVMQFKSGAGDELNFRYVWANNQINYNTDPKPATSDGDVQIRFFRQTNTTGAKNVIFFRGNSTVEASAVIGVDGHKSYFQAHGGDFGIGTYFPETKLTVKGESGIKLIGDDETKTDDYMLLQPNVEVSDLNPGQTIHASRITGRHLGHLVVDITANDNDDAFAIRTDANQDGAVDRISMVVKPSGTVGIGTTTTAASAILDIQSTDKGVLVPRLSTGQRTAISNPASGLLVYDSEEESFFFFKNATDGWKEFISGADYDLTTVTDGETVDLTLTGSQISAEVKLDLAPGNNNILSSSEDGLKATEEDPKVAINADNYLPKWNGSALVQSASVYEAADGKVGIGTTAPAVNLQIVGGESSSSSTGVLKLTTASSNTNMVLDGNEINSYSTLSINNNSEEDILLVGGADGQVGIGISSSSNLPGEEYKLAVGGKISGNEIRVDFAGIGVPTTTALPNGYKLAVDGNVVCEELKVKNSGNWPDHVFEKDYPLLPLPELEKSIRQNGHLPGIPSAAEVQANGGVEVGDMQRRLLEKVEEMTLYILQLEKRIKELEEKK